MVGVTLLGSGGTLKRTLVGADGVVRWRIWPPFGDRGGVSLGGQEAHLSLRLRLVRTLAVEIHEGWIEGTRYRHMELLREHKRELHRESTDAA